MYASGSTPACSHVAAALAHEDHPVVAPDHHDFVVAQRAAPPSMRGRVSGNRGCYGTSFIPSALLALTNVPPLKTPKTWWSVCPARLAGWPGGR